MPLCGRSGISGCATRAAVSQEVLGEAGTEGTAAIQGRQRRDGAGGRRWARFSRQAIGVSVRSQAGADVFETNSVFK